MLCAKDESSNCASGARATAAASGLVGRAAWRLLRQLRSESGSAVIEFVILAVLIMVPLALGAVVVVKVQAATFGTVTAAREAGRAFVTSDNPTQARQRALAAARLALADHNLPSPQVSIRCLNGSCLAPGSSVRIEVTSRVAVPFVPTRSGKPNGTVPVAAVHESVVDSYRSS